MAVPKRKTSPSRRGMRRSADALAQPTYVEDKDFGRAAPPPSRRSQDRHVSGTPDPQIQKRNMIVPGDLERARVRSDTLDLRLLITCLRAETTAG